MVDVKVRSAGHWQQRASHACGFNGYWSRRITDEHRLIYKISGDEVRIAACRYHYGT